MLDHATVWLHVFSHLIPSYIDVRVHIHIVYFVRHLPRPLSILQLYTTSTSQQALPTKLTLTALLTNMPEALLSSPHLSNQL